MFPVKRFHLKFIVSRYFTPKQTNLKCMDNVQCIAHIPVSSVIITVWCYKNYEILKFNTTCESEWLFWGFGTDTQLRETEILPSKQSCFEMYFNAAQCPRSKLIVNNRFQSKFWFQFPFRICLVYWNEALVSLSYN